ncbi:carboxypeptidase-like regulatory domain-containing protein [Sediminicola sp. YIK13]|uniref:carboxypeptidase-like regulatory domain-containing protein n=1 Tax=Sediminicola sp. YIK13 TaxID=1453352 RepID=UPI000784FE30|nr:carboxypeptidase-like regulatory domain-containing protein [Sediminicola sp. YIK13]
MGVSAEAQTFFSKELEGRVLNESGDVAATHVMNTTTNRATITSVDGFFKIGVSLNDTLVFSAVQFKKKELVVTQSILQSKSLFITMEDALTELDEVVVRPYNLSGDISKDLETLETEPVVTASTIGLPNAYVKPMTQTQRILNEATTGGGILPLNPILNGISGRTKMLKKRLEIEEKYARTERVRAFYSDSLYVQDLKIPIAKIDDFMYYCEADESFSSLVDTHDRLKIWSFFKKKSIVYRENNGLE